MNSFNIPVFDKGLIELSKLHLIINDKGKILFNGITYEFDNAKYEDSKCVLYKNSIKVIEIYSMLEYHVYSISDYYLVSEYY